ncbi:MAG: hypothetical protein E6P95_01120 [Candidatus Moraniibacteriota bacterium]|nr:MAG: hypothetical protein E6P95_01120 [Candidatus Moranbacteria bacterium]
MKWFVEAKTTEAADRINNLLLLLGVVPEWSSGQVDTLGNRHDVCEVYSYQNARRIHTVTLNDSRVQVNYWKRDETSGAKLESARYLVIVAPGLKVRRQMKYKGAKGALKKRATA